MSNNLSGEPLRVYELGNELMDRADRRCSSADRIGRLTVAATAVSAVGPVALRMVGIEQAFETINSTNLALTIGLYAASSHVANNRWFRRSSSGYAVQVKQAVDPHDVHNIYVENDKRINLENAKKDHARQLTRDDFTKIFTPVFSVFMTSLASLSAFVAAAAAGHGAARFSALFACCAVGAGVSVLSELTDGQDRNSQLASDLHRIVHMGQQALVDHGEPPAATLA